MMIRHSLSPKSSVFELFKSTLRFLGGFYNREASWGVAENRETVRESATRSRGHGFLVARVFEKTGLLVTPPLQRNRARKREMVGDEATRKVEGKGVKYE